MVIMIEVNNYNVKHINVHVFFISSLYFLMKRVSRHIVPFSISQFYLTMYLFDVDLHCLPFTYLIWHYALIWAYLALCPYMGLYYKIIK